MKTGRRRKKAALAGRLRRMFCLICLIFLTNLCFAVKSFTAAEPVRLDSIPADDRTEYLDLGTGEITDWEEFQAFLYAHPGLKKVDIYATEIRPKRAEELHRLFPEIEFGMTIRIREHLLRTDATAFSTLHDSRSERHTDEELSAVRYCRHLYALDLGHNALTDLSFLRELPELRVLIIAMDYVTDISPVGELKHLEYLEIFNNDISDISCLAGLPYLLDLNLVHNRIGDLRPVMKIQSLKRLWMNSYQIGLTSQELKAMQAEIQKALPDCQVDAKSVSIGGGWRTHPHYEVIHRIFETGIYEPFADSPEENQP